MTDESGWPARLRATGFILLIGAIASACQARNSECRQSLRPILFVHGSGLSSSTWEPMRAAFRAAGYPDELLRAIDLRPNDGANIVAAETQIAPAVSQLLDTAGGLARSGGCSAPRRVDLISHSMGAISARWYAAHVDASRVRNLIGIAPANHGSDELCRLSGDGNRELCPAFGKDPRSNAVQVRLNGTRAQPRDETPYGVGADRDGVAAIPPDAGRRINYMMIRLEPDEWIVPAESALLSGSGGLSFPGLADGAVETAPGNIRWPAGVSHDDLPKDARLIGLLVKALMRDAG